jgi:hypothetical protein
MEYTAHFPLKSHDVSTSLWIQLPKGGGLISFFLCVQVVRNIPTNARPRLRTSHYAGCYPRRPQLFYNSVSDSYIYPRPIVPGLAYTPKLHLPTSNPTQHKQTSQWRQNPFSLLTTSKSLTSLAPNTRRDQYGRGYGTDFGIRELDIRGGLC